MIEHATIAEARAWSRAQRAAGRRIGFVPTMGFLHAGHLRLIDRARALADVAVVSVFVNPTQFGPQEDLSRYPRDLARDRAAAEARGVAALFIPTAAAMYPDDPAGGVSVTPGPLADHLCGPFRPGHFAGVLTVVAKLLHIVEPDVAVFGRKDVQQAQLIRRMVADLNFPVTVDVAPTAREADGLALSSRNVYLSPQERRLAAAVPRALDAGHAAFAAGERSTVRLVATIRAVLDASGGIEVEYLEAVNADTLAPTPEATAETILATAVRVGGTRLIDNVPAGRGTRDDPRV